VVLVFVCPQTMTALHGNLTLCFVGKRRYNIKLWKTFTDCFNCLPIAAIVDEKIFCCHGGELRNVKSGSGITDTLSPILLMPCGT